MKFFLGSKLSGNKISGVFSQVKDDELEHERKMQEAMEKIQRANEFRQVNFVILDRQDLHLETLKPYVTADLKILERMHTIAGVIHFIETTKFPTVTGRWITDGCVYQH